MDAERKKPSIVRQAFVVSLPVLTGYSTMGFAAGVLLALHGGLQVSWLWAGASSALLVSGPLQFLFIDWVRSGTAYADVAALVVCLNIRYSLYEVRAVRVIACSLRLSTMRIGYSAWWQVR